MYCIRIVNGGHCGFTYDPDAEGTPGQQHGINNSHVPIWSTEDNVEWDGRYMATGEY